MWGGTRHGVCVGVVWGKVGVGVWGWWGACAVCACGMPVGVCGGVGQARWVGGHVLRLSAGAGEVSCDYAMPFLCIGFSD